MESFSPLEAEIARGVVMRCLNRKYSSEELWLRDVLNNYRSTTDSSCHADACLWAKANGHPLPDANKLRALCDEVGFPPISLDECRLRYELRYGPLKTEIDIVQEPITELWLNEEGSCSM